MVRDKPVFEVCFWSHLNNTILGRSCPLFLGKEKLRHSLGQPSRSDFVQFKFAYSDYNKKLFDKLIQKDYITSAEEEWIEKEDDKLFHMGKEHVITGYVKQFKV